MTIVKIKVGDNEYLFEFTTQPTVQQLEQAMETIGGRPKRT